MTDFHAQHAAGPAYGEGRDAYRTGKSIEECLATSYYANHAPMIAGAWHVARGYADAAKEAGADALTQARLALAGSDYRRGANR